MCLFAMIAASTSVMAQEITITLNPGWTWLSCPSLDTLDIATVLGSFTPSEGDNISSQNGFATYYGNQWIGNISQFYPGYGYKYMSRRTEPITLTFQVQQPASHVVVTTSAPTNVTAASAVVDGIVTLDAGNHVYVCGVCWDTLQMPTVDKNHKAGDIDTVGFTTKLKKLTPNTAYYVRAYAVTDLGLVYGDEQSFTTLDNTGSGNVPDGAVNGLFTINDDGDQVYFSQGNLQYRASSNTWRFAVNQYDYIGNANTSISSAYSGWIDLFGWGTSGNNHGSTCYQPWSTSSNYVDYYAYGIWNKNLGDETGMADWGYNAVSNGGNQENMWRTFTQAEWDYVIYNRETTSDIRFAKATVNGVHGVILLPDNWNESTYALNDANEGGAPYETNVITVSDWDALEALGVVFLPAAGYRYGASTINYLNSYGYYWSASYEDSRYAFSLNIADNWLNSEGDSQRYFGRSVRLVRDAE